ncbi:MAG: hypothetical protein KA335_11600, partial [Ramlibacter sp.]|nr:hypothetical protein [Ramlibacter sp.]
MADDFSHECMDRAALFKGQRKMGADLSAPMFWLMCNAPAGRRRVTPSSDAVGQRASTDLPPSTTAQAPSVTEMGMLLW